MGLTVHYRLRASGRLPTEEAHALVCTAHARAKAFVRRRGLAGITPMRPADPDAPWCLAFAKERRSNGDIFHDVAPLRGWIFDVLPGRDCEPLSFGLCRYPATLHVQNRRVRTGCRGWTFAGHCKTQYASLHGEAHFLRCHRAVIDLLLNWQRLGLEVEISDEGNYWPNRDGSSLLVEVRQMNAAVAALAGAVKDATDDASVPVQAPIFGHAAFERLEAEGATRQAAQLADAVRNIASLSDAAQRQPQREKRDDELI